MNVAHGTSCSHCLTKASLHTSGTALRLVAANQSTRVGGAQAHVSIKPNTKASPPPALRISRPSTQTADTGYITASIRAQGQINLIRPQAGLSDAQRPGEAETSGIGSGAAMVGGSVMTVLPGVIGGVPPMESGIIPHADGDEVDAAGTDADASHDHHHDGEEEAQDAKDSMRPRRANGKPLNESELRLLRELQRRDREIRQHEQAHLAAAGSYARGGVSFDYQTGPDGKRYAIGGKVDIDTSPEESPEKTIRKMRTVRRAALAPKDPSSQDRRVAAQASQQEMKAERQRLQQQLEERQRLREASQSDPPASSERPNTAPAPSPSNAPDAPVAASVAESNRPNAAEAFELTQADQRVPDAVAGAIKNANRIFSSLNAPRTYSAPPLTATPSVSFVA